MFICPFLTLKKVIKYALLGKGLPKCHDFAITSNPCCQGGDEKFTVLSCTISGQMSEGKGNAGGGEEGKNSMAECLPSILKALSSSPITEIKRKKGGREGGKGERHRQPLSPISIYSVHAQWTNAH
jgi:hypothetical protein